MVDFYDQLTPFSPFYHLIHQDWYFGAPAKPIRALSDQQRIWLKQAADRYIMLTRQSLGIADTTVHHSPPAI
jgi:hypothetical protein